MTPDNEPPRERVSLVVLVALVVVALAVAVAVVASAKARRHRGPAIERVGAPELVLANRTKGSILDR